MDFFIKINLGSGFKPRIVEYKFKKKEIEEIKKEFFSDHKVSYADFKYYVNSAYVDYGFSLCDNDSLKEMYKYLKSSFYEEEKKRIERKIKESKLELEKLKSMALEQ